MLFCLSTFATLLLIFLGQMPFIQSLAYTVMLFLRVDVMLRLNDITEETGAGMYEV